MKLLLTLLIFGVSTMNWAQNFAVSTVVPLDGIVFETSGLIWIDGRLITHNDSGGGHYLYEVDTVDGEIIRTVVVANASNTDWEDLCYDDTYIYIGDFGNNAGTRTDLKIYRILITDYLTAVDDTVYCDTILFNYADQIDFEPATYITNFDAEAFIAYNDSLYLFSKNWGNFETNIYAIPKEPGIYSVSIRDQIDTEGLVTGAAYDPIKDEVMLTGYTVTMPFLFFIKGFIGNQFSAGNLARTNVSLEGSIQIEGVTTLGDHTYLFSSENEGGDAPYLHRVNVSDFVSVQEQPFTFNLYPNPTSNIIQLDGFAIGSVHFYDTRGNLVLESKDKTIDLNPLANGVYQVLITNEANQTIGTTQVIKH